MSNTPPNGHAFVGLLIGGNEDVLRALRGDLYEEFGIEIRNQWLTPREFCPSPPRGTDVILVLTDFCAHQMSRDGVKLAKANRLRYALIGRKKSAWLNGLNLSGFTHKPSWLKPAQVATGPRKEIVMTHESKPNGIPAKAIATPPPIPAPIAMPMPAPAPVTVPPAVDTTAVVLPLPRRWTDEDMQLLVSLAEKFIPTHIPDSLLEDGERFVIENWKASGAFRTASVLRLRVDSLRVLLKLPHGLIVALGRAAARVKKRKSEYMQREKDLLKQPRKDWPDWISADASNALVGHKGRILVHAMLYRPLGMIVYPRVEVDRELTRQEKRGMTADFTGPGKTGLEWERHILEAVTRFGPRASSGLLLHCAPKDGRGWKALRDLLKCGALIEGAHNGVTYYRLPSHAWPPPPRKLGPRKPKTAPVTAGDRVPPPKPSPAPEPAAVPASSTTAGMAEARAEIMRMMRAQEITAREAAELLRALAVP